MARFVDADKLSEKITTEYCGKCGIYNGELCSSCPMNNALNYIDDFPTADVAPRAEVAREILADIRDKGGFNDPFVEYICLSYDELIVLERKYTATTDEPPKGD